MRSYHCTWRSCQCPVFALTLCRNHYRAFRVSCAWTDCQRVSYCRQVCAHHYRKKQFPPVQHCSDCLQPSYIDNKCFYHYTTRLCVRCPSAVYSKQLCQRHYMQQWRKQTVTSPLLQVVDEPPLLRESRRATSHSRPLPTTIQ